MSSISAKKRQQHCTQKPSGGEITKGNIGPLSISAKAGGGEAARKSRVCAYSSSRVEKVLLSRVSCSFLSPPPPELRHTHEGRSRGERMKERTKGKGDRWCLKDGWIEEAFGEGRRSTHHSRCCRQCCCPLYKDDIPLRRSPPSSCYMALSSSSSSAFE